MQYAYASKIWIFYDIHNTLEIKFFSFQSSCNHVKRSYYENEYKSYRSTKLKLLQYSFLFIFFIFYTFFVFMLL